MLTGATLSAIALLALAVNTDAHGNVKEPKPTFESGKSTVEWVVNIDNFWDVGSGGDQVGKFKTMAKEKGMSVRDVVLEMVKDKKCGYTRTDVDPQPIPSDGNVKWRSNRDGGFGHTGPCEVYIDDKMVAHGDNCEEDVPGGGDESNKPSIIPVDYSSCSGKCTLSLYWLAFQNEQWQAYVNCIPLQGSGSATQAKPSAGGSAGGEQPPSTEGEAKGGSSNEEKAPEAETQSKDGSSSKGENSPEPASPPPATAPSAGNGSPSSETQETKCKAPARRLRLKVLAD
ncbi:hypothetical protein F442_07023 [Phytophthora nicotianae P10297]|uniref:Uncharacterized protein n=1 Tax=Phytophthora nicotianae P10297 TaxID=1317064 RepID=W2ZID6_PHYNI|nr:hypothetical protein F442_07023 [Phytophthora nicotianae P10297]